MALGPYLSQLGHKRLTCGKYIQDYNRFDSVLECVTEHRSLYQSQQWRCMTCILCNYAMDFPVLKRKDQQASCTKIANRNSKTQPNEAVFALKILTKMTIHLSSSLSFDLSIKMQIFSVLLSFVIVMIKRSHRITQNLGVFVLLNLKFCAVTESGNIH